MMSGMRVVRRTRGREARPDGPGGEAGTMTLDTAAEPGRREAGSSLGEAELLRLVAQGLSITEIARQRGVPRTDLARMLRRLADTLNGGNEQRAGEAPQADFWRALSLVAYTDGASRGNPGPSGIGVVLLKDGKVLAEKGQPIGNATNNVAEYRAILAALEMARTYGAREVEVRMDSELVARQLAGRYRVRDVRLGKLAVEVQEMARGFDRVAWVHVPRTQNKRADALANQALDRGMSP